MTNNQLKIIKVFGEIAKYAISAIIGALVASGCVCLPLFNI